MAGLIKNAVLKLGTQGFDGAAAGGKKVADSFDRAQSSVTRAAAGAMTLGTGLEKVSSLASRLATATGGSPLLSGLGNILGAGASGFAMGGPLGALANIGLTGATELLGRMGASEKKEINVKAAISVDDRGAIAREIGEQAYAEIVFGVEAKLAEMQDAARGDARRASERGYGRLGR